MSASNARPIRKALLRAGIYRVLARAMSPPSRAGVEAALSACNDLASWPGAWPDSARRVVQTVRDCMGTTDVPALNEEYVRLFGPEARVPLTESSWGDMGRALGRAAQLADISGFYRAFDVRPRDDGESVPEDHLAMELEFMSILNLKEAHAINANLQRPIRVTRDAQRMFLRDHLATWIAYWLEQLADKAPDSIYRRVGNATRSFVANDVSRLGVEPVAIHGRCGEGELDQDFFVCPMASAG